MDHPQERDELRARFTAFLQIMVKRAKLDYLAKTKNRPKIVSLEELPDIVDPKSEITFSGEQKDFEFEEERLAQAFATLPLMRRTVLKLLFVDELSPQEIAAKLHCSVGHVYNQRSLALKRLRLLLNGGDDNE